MRKCASDIDSLSDDVRQKLLSGWFGVWETIMYDEESDWGHYEPSKDRLRYLCRFLSKTESPLAFHAEIIGGLCVAVISGGESKLEELWELYQSISDDILDPNTKFPLYLVSWEFNNFGSRDRTRGFVNRFKNCDTFEDALKFLKEIT